MLSSRVFTTLAVLTLWLSGCDRLEPHEQRILEACGTLDPDFDATRQAAYRGELAAIDCEIAIADGVFMGPYDDPPYALFSVTFRYLRWIVTGEQPDNILELAALCDQAHLEADLVIHYSEFLRATGQIYAGRYDKNGCFLRPPRMDQLYRAAQPHPDMAACESAVRDHPFG
ncbi:hypothetical protein [Oceanicaulis sp.]|uniref:hypothetical protein n=1 Tax=Oceanicaulis sp. TaxID=1924941 RepID=UPI003F722F02